MQTRGDYITNVIDYDSGVGGVQVHSQKFGFEDIPGKFP